jgi:3',5'-cyclic AMP phosphodiesterase CpdA
MLIAQISDMHVKAAGELLFDSMDSYGMLAAALADIATLEPTPDLLIATGDLAADGTPAEYAALRGLLDALPIPYLLLPGNHDIREALRDAFPDQPWEQDGEFLHYVVEDYPLRLVALDTLIPGAPGGSLCAERLDWLSARLDDAPDRPTAIFMHHPPFDTGIDFMDRMGLETASELAEILESHSQVVRVLCGHLHRAIHTALGNVQVSVAPSTCFQVQLKLNETPGIALTREPAAYQLHIWRPGFGLVSHVAYVENYGEWGRV